MRLSMGGTHNLEHWKFSDIVNALMVELGVDTKEMLRNKEFEYGRNGKNGPSLWFDAETYGKNKLVTGCELEETDPHSMVKCIDEFPVSETAREQLKYFYTVRTNVFKGKSEKDVIAYLQGTSYTDFLREYGGLGDEAIQLFGNAQHTNWAIEIRSLSVLECLNEGLPGVNLLGREPVDEDWDYPVVMFPDGNASIAQLLVQSLIPNVAPGANASNITMANSDAGAGAYTHVAIDEAFRSIWELP